MKNNLKKICSVFFSSLGLFLLFFILSGQQASASAGESLSWFSVVGYGVNPNFSGTITSGTNQVLICSWVNRDNSANGTVLAWHGVPLTVSYTGDVGGYGNSHVGYLVAPDVGTYNITNTGTGYISGVNCYVLEGINQTTPINNNSEHTSFSGSLSQSYASSTSGAYLVSSFGLSSITMPTLISGSSADTNSGIRNYSLYYGINSTIYTVTGASAGAFIITELNYDVAPPTTNDYFYFWSLDGSGSSSSTPIYNIYHQNGGGISSLLGDYVYNFCDSYSSSNYYTMAYVVNGVEISRQLMSDPACSDIFDNQHFYTIPLASSTGTSTLAIYSIPKFGYADIDETQFVPLSSFTPVVSSNVFYSNIASSDSVDSAFAIYQGLSIIPLVLGATSTPIRVGYNYCSSSYKIDVTKICAIDGITCYTPVSCAGEGTLIYPTGVLGGTITSNFLLENASSTILYTGKQFSLSWSGSGGASARLGSNVCTDAEWADTGTDFLGYSGVRFGCIVKGSLFGFFNLLLDYFNQAMNQVLALVSNLFPFNVPIRVKQAWDSSAFTALPTDLTYMDVVDSSGNLSFTVPAGMTGTGTSSTSIIFGLSAWSSAPAMSNFFGAIRFLSSYLMGWLFFWRIWGMGVILLDVSAGQKGSRTLNGFND